ncbi:MAG: RNA polymerase subunit sigma-24 [Azospira oryzae]|jgi:RNA polymerase sigma factor (sigma-70 family)|nr:MAG: RNA polymerase subunit sigma-24 [Azospira oryzae]
MQQVETGKIKPIVDHLFRYESGKLLSVLTRIFGIHNLELAEDVVQDTLIKAMENWKINGVPDNPSGWLFTTARNKALDVIRRERHHKDFAAEISPLLKSEYSAGETLREFIHENEVEDEQLRMMFVCCHPSIAEEGQIALILKTLCGFSIAEIAKAFITNDETIGKRLYRARQQFREEHIAFVIPSAEELPLRLSNVLVAVYLLFNEGYNSTHHDSLIRDDLVEEALRLGKMLADHPVTGRPETLALLALMCFQAARLYGRVDQEGNLLSIRDQDRKRWNSELIEQGAGYLRNASQGNVVSAYHLEAAIAYEHCIAIDFTTTDWNKIIQLYDWLYTLKPDPLIALNRLIAFGEVHGPMAALNESSHLPDQEALKKYYLYPAALGEWCARAGKYDQAKVHFTTSLQLTQSPAEKRLLERKIENLPPVKSC